MEQSSVANHFRITTGNASKQNFSLMHSYRPIYIVSRTFGQMPFSITYHSNGDIHRPVITKLDALWFLLSLSAIICFAYFGFLLFDLKEVFGSLSPISAVGNFSICCISAMLDLIAIIWDMYYRFIFVDMFRNIAMFDQKVRLLQLEQ